MEDQLITYIPYPTWQVGPVVKEAVDHLFAHYRYRTFDEFGRTAYVFYPTDQVDPVATLYLTPKSPFASLVPVR